MSSNAKYIGAGILALTVGTTPPTELRAQDLQRPATMRASCPYDGTNDGGGSVKSTVDNTIIFNHRDLTASQQRLYVLEVDDGGYFQVVFQCTAPSFFTYTITGDPSAQPDSATGATLPESVTVTVPLTSRGITMRHDARFLRYRVTARVREGLLPVTRETDVERRAAAPPPIPLPERPIPPPPTPPIPPEEAQPVQLYSVSFDIWVVTKPDWRLGVIGGVAISSLVDKKYAISIGESGAKTFEESPTGQSQRATDVMALANVYYSKTFLRTLNAGGAFGFGSSGTSPRFFLGPSIVFGKYFVFTGGWAVGSVAAPPVGQALGKPPVNGDNTLNSLSRQVVTRRFFGIGFTWIDRRDQFAAALSAAASASGAVGSCVVAVKPDAVTFDAKGAPSSDVTVEAGADCTWIATLQSGTNLFNVVSGGSAKGKGTIKLSTETARPGGRSDVLNVVGPSGSAPKQVKLTQGPPS